VTNPANGYSEDASKDDEFVGEIQPLTISKGMIHALQDSCELEYKDIAEPLDFDANQDL
jgi:hypothetical protein